ncbi:MAG: site-specific DNA-methyltransferase [Planctomycetota bacterium]
MSPCVRRVAAQANAVAASDSATSPPSLPLDSIVCGDNCEVTQTFPASCIDLVVTSPPYDGLRSYGGATWSFEGVASQLYRVLKDGGVIVWNVGDQVIEGSESGTSFEQALAFKRLGLRLHDTMIYKKTGGGNLETYRYYQGFEYVFILSKGQPKAFNPICDRPNEYVVNRADESGERKKMGRRYNIWEYPNGGGHMGDCGDHEAPMPEGLARDHILSWSNEGDIVLDPFSGSGTTAKMAKHNGRRFIGIEVNPRYCEIAEQRLAQNVLF